MYCVITLIVFGGTVEASKKSSVAVEGYIPTLVMTNVVKIKNFVRTLENGEQIARKYRAEFGAAGKTWKLSYKELNFFQSVQRDLRVRKILTFSGAGHESNEKISLHSSWNEKFAVVEDLATGKYYLIGEIKRLNPVGDIASEDALRESIKSLRDSAREQTKLDVDTKIVELTGKKHYRTPRISLARMSILRFAGNADSDDSMRLLGHDSDGSFSEYADLFAGPEIDHAGASGDTDLATTPAKPTLDDRARSVARHHQVYLQERVVGVYAKLNNDRYHTVINKNAAKVKLKDKFSHEFYVQNGELVPKILRCVAN